MSVAQLTSDYRKFIGTAPNTWAFARLYALRSLHNPATGWSHTPAEIASVTNHPKHLIARFCDDLSFAATMSLEEMLTIRDEFRRDEVIEAYFRQRLASETVVVTHIRDVCMRVMGNKCAFKLLALLSSAGAVPKSINSREPPPHWISQSYQGETNRDRFPKNCKVCGVEVIEKIEAAFPALGSDAQWLLTKAKRLTRARLTGNQHQIMKLAVFSRNDDERRWATSYMALVDYLEATP
jgi:hypothetical protein